MEEEDRSIHYLLQIVSKSMIKKRKWALEERRKCEGPYQALVVYEKCWCKHNNNGNKMLDINLMGWKLLKWAVK